MFNDVRAGTVCQEAEISRSRRWVSGFRLESMANLMKVDLLVAKFQCSRSTLLIYTLEPQNTAVKRARVLERTDGQNE